jgi:hypothetical protein
MTVDSAVEGAKALTESVQVPARSNESAICDHDNLLRIELFDNLLTLLRRLESMLGVIQLRCCLLLWFILLSTVRIQCNGRFEV